MVRKIYKKNIQNILFSKIKKNMKKINLYTFIYVFILSLATLLLIDFSALHETIDAAWYSIDLFFAVLFIATGYSWVSKMQITNSNKRSWFVAMYVFGALMIPFKFLLSGQGISYMLTPFAVYLLIILVYNFMNLPTTQLRGRTWTRWISVINNILWLLSVIMGLLFMSRTIDIGKTSITFISLMVLGIIGLNCFKLWTTRKTIKGFLLTGDSVLIISLAVVLATSVWSLKILIMHFTFGAIALGIGIGQIVILYFFMRLLRKDDNEFSSDFIKSYIANIGMLVQLVLIIVSKEAQVNFVSYGDSHYINIVLSGISIVVIMYFIYKKDISRNKWYKLLDVISLFVFAGSLIALSLLQEMGILESASTLEVDESIVYGSAGFISLNIILSTFSWIFASTNKHKEKEWK